MPLATPSKCIPALFTPVLLALLLSSLLTACSDGSDSRDDGAGPDPLPQPNFIATIERTEFGTAHVTADNWGSLGFGQGYAFAEDRFCVLADQIVKVRSQRARYFGAGVDNANLVSDFAYLGLGVIEKAEAAIAGLSEEGREMLQGYVAGFNQYLQNTGVDSLPGGCASADWVAEIDESSLMAYYLDVAMLAGSRNFLDAIANAAPPGGVALSTTAPVSRRLPKGAASNGVAMGADYTASGRGLLLSNTHLPWEGELKYHEVHLRIPDVIDVAGISISGAMGVQIGFNQSMAWTHTTSPSNQFVLYTLELVPGNPTRYRFGDEERDMISQSYSVEVLNADGSMDQVERTLYGSQYGPMLDPSAFGLSWTESSAYSIFDMNAENGGLMDTFLSMARADSVAALRNVFETVGGVPWNHTMATDSSGALLYADTTLVPNLSPEAEAAFQAQVESDAFSFAKIAFGLGLVALDGSDPLYSVQVDDTATLPGAIPFRSAPKLLERRDFVANSNDSYWLSNPAQPLDGYPIRYGSIETPRSLRTRMGLTQILESDAWDRSRLKDMLFANRSFTAELWRARVADICADSDQVASSDGAEVDIAVACSAISNWEGQFNLDSRGAISFREMLGEVDRAGLFNGISYFAVPFDPAAAVTTPSGLTTEGEQYLLTQLADATLRLAKVGIAPDAPLGDHQYSLRGDERFAIHGGQQHSDGIYNKVDYTFDAALNSSLLPQIPRPPVVNASTDLTENGYLINYGASFIMAVGFTDDGPEAEAILTYSQSDDPAAANFSDQTALYSSKTWRPLPYSREQIESDPNLSTTEVNDL